MKPVGLASIIILSTVLTLHGQVGVETKFGFNGYYYPDRPTPIQIRVRGHGPPLRGRIILSQEVKSPWQGAVTESLALPFELPGRSEKLFQLSFPVHGYIYPLSVTVLADDQPLYRQEIELKRRFLDEPLTLALGEDPFPGELPTGERTIQIDPQALPPQWAGLLGVRRIYLGRFNPSSLSQPQRQALLRWLEWGGELIVLGGDNWYLQDSPYLRELLPFQPREVGQRGGRAVVRGEPRGVVLYGESFPILIAGQRGRGRVIFSAVDPLQGSTESDFWEQLSAGNGRASLSPHEERLGLAGDLLGQQELPFPSKFALIGIYSLFIGGLALLGWGARHRQWLAFAIPLWIAGVMVLAAGYIDRPQFAKPLVGLELALVHDLGNTTLHTLWFGLFARSEAAVTLPVPLDVEKGHIMQQIPRERGRHLYDADYRLAQEETQVSFRMDEWQGRAFYLERFSGNLANLQVGGGQIVVKNLTPYPFRGCRLFDGRSLYAIGDIGPFEELTGEVGPEVRGPEEPPLARLHSLAQREIIGGRALLCMGTLDDLPPLPWEKRTVAGLVMIEEDLSW